MKKMLCFDLDDTLLRNDKTISNFTIGILRKWKEKGGMIIFATARSKIRVLDYLNVIDVDGLVALHGAFTYKKESLVNEFCVDDSLVAKLQELCCIHNDCFMSVFIENKTLTNFSPFLNHNDCEFNDFSKIKLAKVGKILFLTEKYLSHDIMNLLNKCRYTKDPIYSSYSIYDLNSNKINSIELLCAQLNVDLSNVYCFGNDDNDIEMLQKCGTGIAVANSSNSLLKIADDVCLSNDEDGPAKWIEKYLL